MWTLDTLVRHGRGKPKERTKQGSSMLASAVIHTQVETHELSRPTWGSDIRAEGESVGRLGGSDSCLHRRHCEDTLIHPTEGTCHSFPGHKCWSSGICRLHWIQSCQATPCYGCNHLHSYRILQLLGFFSSITSLLVSFAHFYKLQLQLPLVSWWS